MKRGRAYLELRNRVMERARGRCEWPFCVLFGDRLAHIQSRGMGGSPSRDDPLNVFWSCPMHGQVSDGIPPEGYGVSRLRLEWGNLPCWRCEGIGCKDCNHRGRLLPTSGAGAMRDVHAAMRLHIERRETRHGRGA